MITLYQFPPCFGIPNASPFCMKLETYLRMTKLPYQNKSVMDPRKAPKGKLPYIDDGDKRVADSSLIINYLKEKYGDSLDQHLSPEQKAQGLSLQRLLEEHLYWCMLYSRWIDETNWPATQREFFGKLPFLMRSFISNSVRKAMRAQLHAHGLGRHTKDEIYQMGLDNLATLSTLLHQHAFALGEEPSSIDACVYGFLANLIHVPTDSPLNDYAKSQPVFVNYCERMKAKYF